MFIYLDAVSLFIRSLFFFKMRIAMLNAHVDTFSEFIYVFLIIIVHV